MNPVYAAIDWFSTPGCRSTVENAEGVATIQCLDPLFQNVANSVIAISVVAIFIVLLIGGFKFLFSAGDQKKLESARGSLTNAIVGLVVIVLAYLIIKAIATITGMTGLTQFQIPTQ